MISSREQTIKVLKDLNFNGNKSELRKEYQNLFLVVKPQKSRFGEHMYLNFGVVYKPFMKGRTPKLTESLMEFRFSGVLEVLKEEHFNQDIDESFHLPEFENEFKVNYNIYIEKLIQSFDDLHEMKTNFPKNIPVLKIESSEYDYSEVIFYHRHKETLKKYFNESG